MNKNIFIITVIALVLFSCKESTRFEIGYNDTQPPAPPTYISQTPTYGGAIIRFQAPDDEDVLSVDAIYLNHEGKEVWFSASFYTDTIQILGLSDTLPKTIQLFAVDRAGNKSSKIDVIVHPLKSAVSMLSENVFLTPGFSSFFINWTNVLEQDMNVFVDYSYSQNGSTKTNHVIYTSNEATEQRLIRDLETLQNQPVNVSIRVEDLYGNSISRDMGSLTILEDEKIPKDKWSHPNTNDSIGGVPMAFLDAAEGRCYKLYDDIIDGLVENNFAHTHWIGRTGNPEDGNAPWNLMIDLGDDYELSRIITYQRHVSWIMDPNDPAINGYYYAYENVSTYRMYTWDEDIQQWDTVRTHKITFPPNLTPRQYWQLGYKGDMAYMYPDNPGFTKKTRWFRYEALNSFNDNSKGTDPCSACCRK